MRPRTRAGTPYVAETIYVADILYLRRSCGQLPFLIRQVSTQTKSNPLTSYLIEGHQFPPFPSFLSPLNNHQRFPSLSFYSPLQKKNFSILFLPKSPIKTSQYPTNPFSQMPTTVIAGVRHPPLAEPKPTRSRRPSYLHHTTISAPLFSLTRAQAACLLTPPPPPPRCFPSHICSLFPRILSDKCTLRR